MKTKGGGRVSIMIDYRGCSISQSVRMDRQLVSTTVDRLYIPGNVSMNNHTGIILSISALLMALFISQSVLGAP